MDKESIFVTSCVEFPQRNFNLSVNEARKIKSPGRKPRLHRITHFIEKTNGHALVAYANIEKSLIPPGKKDDATLPGVTRYNTLWGAVMTYAAAEMIASLVRNRIPFTTVDIFYDDKSLTEEHREAIGDVIRKNVRKLTRTYISHHTGILNPKPRFRKIQPVSKTPSTSQEGKYQIGTWLADRLCHYYDEIVSIGDSGVISARNCSSDVKDIFLKLEAANNA